MSHRIVWRLLLGLISAMGLACMYLFQDSGLGKTYLPYDLTARLIVSKSLRYLINDIFSIGLIYSFFPERAYLQVAVLIQILGTVFLLVPYFILKLYFNLGNGPLVSFLHRIVLNPILMLLLIPAFFMIHYSQNGSQSGLRKN